MSSSSISSKVGSVNEVGFDCLVKSEVNFKSLRLISLILLNN